MEDKIKLLNININKINIKKINESKPFGISQLTKLFYFRLSAIRRIRNTPLLLI